MIQITDLSVRFGKFLAVDQLSMDVPVGQIFGFLGPKVLICDEPTANLDSHSTSLVRRLLEELRSEGTTIFLTTHNMTEVEEICDRVAILSRGTLVDSDTPVAFMTRHAERKVRVERHVKGQQVRQLFDLDNPADRSQLAALITDHSDLRVHSLDFRFEDVFRKLTGDTYQ